LTEVRFCSLCDESVPESEVQDGRVLVLEKRSLCVDCKRLVAKVGSSSRGPGIGVIGVGLALVAGATSIWGWQMERREMAKVVGDQAARLERAERSADRQALRGEKSAREVSKEVSSLIEELAVIASGFRQWESETVKSIQSLEVVAQAGVEAASRQESFARDLKSAQGELGLLDEKVRSLRTAQEGFRDKLDTLEALQKAAALNITSGEKTSRSKFSVEIAGRLKRLIDDDPQVRYEALESLSREEDARLVPQVLPLLADSHEFNRFLAASILGKWEARTSVPFLVEALGDSFSFVREAAVVALRKITGQNFRFDPVSEESNRELAIQSWRTWWQANGKSFLGQEG